MYRIFINDRNYISWKITDMVNHTECDPNILSDFNPLENRLFTNDIITENGTLVCSYIRECPTLAGMLMLADNKTYGRTENKKRLLYKCIPDDKRLPVFLVPFDIKLGFSKNIQNKYVVFKFDTWTTDHPRGLLIDVLGDTNKLDVFYEYKLYCRNLNISNKEFAKKTHKLFRPECTEEYIQQILNNPFYTILDHTDRFVFTIDPKNSLDFDDGFSIECGSQTTTLTIYISNVFIWLETFQLWQSFNKRVSTIYLPDRRRPMLPTILSDNLCSLLENQPRFAFCMDVVIDNTTSSVLSTNFYNSMIRVCKNFVYEESALLKNKHYKNLLEITNKIIEEFKSNKDSHDVVSYWMVFMNKTCAEKLYEKKVGIFRTICEKQHSDANTSISMIEKDSTISKETKQFMKNWISIYGSYVVFSEERSKIEHSLLTKDTSLTNDVRSIYTHITSPIRRLVDLLNQILFFVNYELYSPSESAIHFLEEWIRDIDIINDRMKSAVKVERECEIIHKCLNDPTILTRQHNVYIINRCECISKYNENMYKYLLYLEDEKILLTMKNDEKRDVFKKNKIQLYKIESYGVATKIKVAWCE